MRQFNEKRKRPAKAKSRGKETGLGRPSHLVNGCLNNSDRQCRTMKLDLGAPAHMNSNELVLAVVSKARKVPGRTSLQKICYFANEFLRTQIAFRPHFFGPFSVDVADSANVLVSADLIDEQIESGTFLKSGKAREWTRHTYSISQDGLKYLAWLEKRGPGLDPRLEEIVRRLKSLTDFDQDSLSKLAKVHYIRKELGRHSPNGSLITKRARELGWTLSASDVRLALSHLAELEE